MFGLLKLTFALGALPVRVAMIPVRVAGRQLLRIPVVRAAADRAVRVLPARLRGGGKKTGKKGKGKQGGKKGKPDEARQNYLAARTPRPGETPGSKSSGGQGGDQAMQKQMAKMHAQQMKFQQQMFKQQMEWQRQNSTSVADMATWLTKLLASKEGSALDTNTLVRELAQRGVAPQIAQAAIREAHGKGWIKKAGQGRIAASAKSVRAHGVPDEVAQRRQRRAM